MCLNKCHENGFKKATTFKIYTVNSIIDTMEVYILTFISVIVVAGVSNTGKKHFTLYNAFNIEF